MTNVWVLIGIPIGGFIIAAIVGMIYLKYCDEYSARQFIKDAYLEGVKPAPTKIREVIRRQFGKNAPPRRIRVNLSKGRECHEDLADPLARQRVRLARFLEGSSERSTPAIPLQRTAGISPVPMTSSPTDLFEPDSSKPAPNTSSSEKSEAIQEKPEDESVEWPYR
jgi:hypothetical protein